MTMTPFEMGLLLILSIALSAQFGYLWLIEQHVRHIANTISEIQSPPEKQMWVVDTTEREAKDE